MSAFVVLVLYLPPTHLFLSFLQVSELRWTAVDDMEDLLKRFCSSYKYGDAPVECATLFHERIQRTMDEWVCINEGEKKGVLGRCVDWVVRYEVQDRG